MKRDGSQYLHFTNGLNLGHYLKVCQPLCPIKHVVKVCKLEEKVLSILIEGKLTWW
jgi:hypothetical protein